MTATAPSETGLVNYSKIGFKGDIITSASKLIVFIEPPQVLTTVGWTSPDVPVAIAQAEPTYPISADVLDQFALDMADGETLYWRIDPASDADFIQYCSVPASSIVSSGSVSTTFTNSTNQGAGTTGAVQVSQNQSTWFTSPSITFENL